MACSMVLAITACGGKGEEASSETSPSTTETTPMVTVAPTTVETTLLEYGMTIQENDQAVTWKEDAIEAKVMYANVQTYLNVRKGPGPDYAGVAKFTKGMLPGNPTSKWRIFGMRRRPKWYATSLARDPS